MKRKGDNYIVKLKPYVVKKLCTEGLVTVTKDGRHYGLSDSVNYILDKAMPRKRSRK